MNRRDKSSKPPSMCRSRNDIIESSRDLNGKRSKRHRLLTYQQNKKKEKKLIEGNLGNP